MPDKSSGVGFLGGGLATQAIHIPVLATLRDRFNIVRVVSPDPRVAAEVARRCGAKGSTREQDVLDDPAVEIVAICSPDAVHARQVIAACKAGKKLIFCEKPLAVTRAEAEEIGRTARATGTPIVVGAMHAYDPAYRAAQAAWAEAQEQADFIQATVFLPSNDVFINQATDPLPSSRMQRAGVPGDDLAFRRLFMRGAILGLAIHDIPLLRDFYPSVGTVVSSRFLPPFGYSISMASRDAQVEFLALLPGTWPADWRLRVMGRRHELTASFPPSYVLAGSAHVVISRAQGTTVFEEPVSGYQAMCPTSGM
ncbi:Gfo/Idh/MocA family oxidoreductase [Bradyrhizobium sp. BRP22]|uniref:Gfo/Idh/MocA family protein n=1 Tax=Bradyrhizobium sp. BRP22 TaxID=2793821 RepID=UPI001CD3619D|nr:Gfo/Idh/MocA family oxidoreductase [Bradyrhizobium sp. BRP22]MCA1454974.1 Gfo/Idh/MocA family oxidoreductase [Bradyrhizobium sp. BRP22]